MKKTKILYWTFTGLFAFMMFGSAIPDVFSASDAVKGMHGALGYPLYFIPFIGTAKALGVIAILVPGFSKIKEWAYAGLTFDLIGATFSLIASGASLANWAFMLLPLALAFCSYFFYRKRLNTVLTTKQKTANVNTRLAAA
jgi:hypothetical protein